MRWRTDMPHAAEIAYVSKPSMRWRTESPNTANDWLVSKPSMRWRTTVKQITR